MPVPLIKPPSKTSAQVDQFFLYEVELAGESVMQFEPRPPVAYSVDDAVLKLAMVLKEGGMKARAIASKKMAEVREKLGITI